MTVRPTQVEFHCTHACNFTCESCSHFSQDGHGGRATVESFRAEVGPWASRLRPKFLLMLGGEPTLNPDLPELLEEARWMWPTYAGENATRILLVTNGWFLHRHPRLPEVLKRCDIRLDITRHSVEPAYLAKLDQIVAFVRDAWHIEPTFRDSQKDWTHIYKGHGKDVMPFSDGDRRKSWKACVSKWCMQLHEGKLWKCPPVAYLPMQHTKFGLSPKWEPYLKYRPLEPDCSDAELEAFCQRQDEDVCNMCPANPVKFVKPDPSKRSPLPMAYES